MYSPKFNLVYDRGILLEAMRAFSFATLFGAANDDEPGGGAVATHLPLVVKDEGKHGLLEGHFAKANRHWQFLAGRETLVVFAGPHSYVSPALYTDPLSVPTWNYIAIHAYGALELIEDELGKEELVKSLIAAHDPAYLKQWRELPDGFRSTMLAGIMGFRIPIARIEGKFKLSQNRNAEERRNIYAAQSAGSPDEQSLARWMDRLAGADQASWRAPAVFVDPPGKPSSEN
jgi:transcriptional regulator